MNKRFYIDHKKLNNFRPNNQDGLYNHNKNRLFGITLISSFMLNVLGKIQEFWQSFFFRVSNLKSLN